jgi:hypothetical protein
VNKIIPGRDELAIFIVNGKYCGDTHDIAAQLLTGRHATRKYHVVADEPGVQIQELVLHYENLLHALEKLAEIGGERLVVDEWNICFFSTGAR